MADTELMGMNLLRSKRGTLAAVSRALGLTRNAAYHWDVVPTDRVVEIEAVTGIPREQLCPHLYRPAGQQLETAAENAVIEAKAEDFLRGAA